MMLRFISSFLLLLSLGITSCLSPHTENVRPDALAFAPLQLVVPEIKPIVLANGVHLYLLEDRELPLIQMTGMIGVGNINDSDDKTGQGELFAALLSEGGAGERGADAFEEYLESLAINLSADIDPYSTTLRLSLLSEDLDAGLQILDDLLRRPRFDPKRLELSKRQMIEAIRRQNDNPQSIAQRVFNANVYGDHPFGQTPAVATVELVEREDLVDFHRTYFTPENLYLAISGDFDRAELEQKIRVLLADWEQGRAMPVEIPALTESPVPAILVAEKEIPQTTVMVGSVGISKDDPDLLTVQVMNAILGGSGFNSRLMREIRSNRGLAYSVYSYYAIGRRLPGSFVASGETKNESAMLMVSLMLDEIEKIRTELVSEEELELAKESRINSFVFAFTDSHDVLTQQLRLDFFDYPPGYLQTYREKITAISREDILRVAQKHLLPKEMVIVLVGQPDQYEAAAENLQRPIKILPQVELPGVSR
ncbi:MAG: insulinase family protein [Desulfuromonadales bacterium]|nr:insulinase family protein [Desulfuromonadales bacterium]